MTEKFLMDRIRFLRNERGISAREMSLSLGQNEAYINKIETGQRSLPMESFFKICEFFKITPCQFFDNEFNNTVMDDKEILSLFHRLSKKQSEILVELMTDLVKKECI